MSHFMQHSQQDGPAELESQIILRLPEVVAQLLRDALKQGSSNLKERLSLKMENDMRHGTLYFDHFVLPTKLVDLPCIIESFKTIDKKNVYKTADICQMLICMEEEEPEEVDPKPQKKKDGQVKVEKKYLWPHGITPPLKNVRKRRFRRTLKKKQYSDQPEIEKEVRRLLRMDYEAHHVSWEVIDEEEDRTKDGSSKDVIMQGSKTNENPSGNASRIAVEELFGDALSDSDAEDGDQVTEMDFETSRLSMDDAEDESSRLSRMSDSMSFVTQDNESKEKPSTSAGLVTSFAKGMFEPRSQASSSSSAEPSPSKPTRMEQSVNYGLVAKRNSLEDQLRQLREELQDISKRRENQEIQLSTNENSALRQRLETVLRKTVDDQNEKERKIQEVEMELASL
ncbi:unnamed protein product [Orchesella dallaii]|uniref:TAFII55 protein conserved region domain-containing protein n=1 Tax=Orchesella dallaii TaxID=48710 RepID=A0ABP1PP43_9HEXA